MNSGLKFHFEDCATLGRKASPLCFNLLESHTLCVQLERTFYRDSPTHPTLLLPLIKHYIFHVDLLSFEFLFHSLSSSPTVDDNVTSFNFRSGERALQRLHLRQLLSHSHVLLKHLHLLLLFYHPFPCFSYVSSLTNIVVELGNAAQKVTTTYVLYDDDQISSPVIRPDTTAACCQHL